MRYILAPSLLAADLLSIREEILDAERLGADCHHIDVMDGHFVPNLSFGLPVLKALRGLVSIPLDVHLMVSNPEQVAKEYVHAGANSISFHVEATKDPRELLVKLKSYGVSAGLAISPSTAIKTIFEALPFVDYVLVMSVEPGFSGQKFKAEVLDRVKEVKNQWIATRRQEEPMIQVDGGVDHKNILELKRAGANSFVVGSYFYNAVDRKKSMELLKAALEKT